MSPTCDGAVYGALVLLHICDTDEWHAATGGEYRPRAFDADGFVHLSRPDQVLGPANRIYRGRLDLVLLVVDEAHIEADIRWEPSAVPEEEGELFPHLYRPLPALAVTHVIAFSPGADGTFTLPPAVNRIEH